MSKAAMRAGQPEALRLADELDSGECCQAQGGHGCYPRRCAGCPRNAADELRRLHTLTAVLALPDAQPVAQEPIGEKLKSGSIRWASDEAMFAYVGPLYAAPQPAAAQPVLQGIADQLRKAGATLPVEVKGTIESAMQSGLSIALVIVEEAIAKQATPQPVAAQPAKLTNKEIIDWWESENGLEDCNLCKAGDFIKAVRAIEQAIHAKQATP